jgi:hypothetical protein
MQIGPFPRNDNVIWIRGVIDSTDPVNPDGTPKWINNALINWKIIDSNNYTLPEDILAYGAIVASGTATSTGQGGTYICKVPNNIVLESLRTYYIHVQGTIPSTNSKFDLLDKFSPSARTGRTAST